MKTDTFNHYAVRIDRAIALLAQRLAAGEPPPTLDEMATAAHFSPFHFHRIYRALTQETLAQTVARLRQDRAAHLLAHQRAVTEVALASGYATPQAFARAFREATGMTPTQARGQTIEAGPASATAPLQVRIASMEPLRIVALRHVGDHANLDTAYLRLFGWAGEQGLLEQLQGLYGIALDDPRMTPAAQTRFDAALALGETPPPAADLRADTLAGGAYLICLHQGSYTGLYPLLDRLYLEALPQAGLEPADAPVFFQYHNEPDLTPEPEWLTDIWLPVRALATNGLVRNAG